MYFINHKLAITRGDINEKKNVYINKTFLSCISHVLN